MEPISIILIVTGVMSAAALTWRTIKSWIEAHKVPSGYAEVLRERLANGKYRVVAGVFDQRGTQVARREWVKTKIDSDLTTRFGNSDAIRIKT
jgi:hypothetical protein